ncbi:MAG TPA: PTS galactitol transporter subunit IIC [Anaerolineae bacterium]|nr:PTS galactitol transporter subunit IIC [Anaerolineae bacterium]
MDWLFVIIDWIKGLGPTVMLPIVIFIIGLILGAKPGRAFRSAVTIGIAFVGINLVIGLLWTNLGDAAQAMVDRIGVSLDVVDVGWPAAAAIAFGGTVGTWIIPLSILVNIIMLAVRGTKTLNVDIWNFWHFAFTGALVFAVSQNLALALATAALNAAIALFLADWTAPGVQDFYSVPAVSIPHGFSAAYVPIAIPLNKLIDVIPGLNKLDADPEAIQRRFGVLGEPIVLGVVIGFILGCLAWLGDATVGNFGTQLQKILVLAINLGAVMLLMPRMVAILMEGLIPISEAAREFMKRRFAGGEFYIGLDSAILIGHPAAIATALLLVPVTIALAIGLSTIGLNRILPFADLAVIPFMVCMIAPITRGNIVRGVIIGTIVIAVGLIIGTTIAPLHTAAAIDAQFDMPEGATQIASICDGTNPLTWLLLNFSQLGGWIGWVIAVVVFGVVVFLYKRNPVAWEIAAGAPRPEEQATEG